MILRKRIGVVCYVAAGVGAVALAAFFFIKSRDWLAGAWVVVALSMFTAVALSIRASRE